MDPDPVGSKLFGLVGSALIVPEQTFHLSEKNIRIIFAYFSSKWSNLSLITCIFPYKVLKMLKIIILKEKTLQAPREEALVVTDSVRAARLFC